MDSTPQGERVKSILQRAKALGFAEVIFNFRAFMITGKSAEIRSSVAPEEQEAEERLLAEAVRHAQGLGLKVAFRPILLVIGPKGEFPFSEKGITWWHGNIMPADVPAWFESYFLYHERYLRMAAELGVSWYSLGAEMHSMTSGRGSRAVGYKYGYPERWVGLVKRARGILGSGVKLTYGINYTDQAVKDGSSSVLGGEFKQWHISMTNEPRNADEIRVQAGLKEFWQELDTIGLDYYRALASGTRFPSRFNPLAELLTDRALSHATQLDTMISEMDLLTGKDSKIFLQELGYRRVNNSFLSPSSYEDRGGEINPLHQAAAWEAVFRGFWDPNWPWMTGLGVWQVLVDTDPSASDKGFSIFGNEEAELVFKARFFPSKN